MTTNAQLIDRVLFHVGRRTAYRAEALAMMKAWVKERERGTELPWFLEVESSGLVTVANQDYVNLPANFLREYDEGIMLITDSEGEEHKVNKVVSMERLLRTDDTDDSEVPRAYYLFNNKIYLKPTPTDAFSLRFFYYRKSTELTDDGTETTFWGLEAENALVYGAAADFAGAIQNFNMERSLKAKADAALLEVFNSDEARKHAAQAYGVED